MKSPSRLEWEDAPILDNDKKRIFLVHSLASVSTIYAINEWKECTDLVTYDSSFQCHAFPKHRRGKIKGEERKGLELKSVWCFWSTKTNKTVLSMMTQNSH